MVAFGPERVIVLVRDGCHLCAEALAAVEKVCSLTGATWRSVDVDSAPSLKAEFSDHVPVTFVDGALHSRWFVDQEALRTALEPG